MNTSDPVAAFKTEADELLDQIEEDLLDLGGNLQAADLINAVFRGLHTLKGSGAMFGFDALAGFTHHCETAFDNVRKGRAPATVELVEVILSAKDHMSALIHQADADHAAASAAIIAKLKAAVDASSDAADAADGLAEASASAPAAAVASQGGWRVRFYLPPEAMANGTNPLSLVDELRELGQAEVRLLSDRLPALDDLVPTECHFGWDVTLVTDAPRSAIDDVFIFVIDDMELSVEPLSPPVADEKDAPAGPAAGSETASPPAAAAVPTDPAGAAAAARHPPRASRPRMSACPPSGSTSSWTVSASWSSPRAVCSSLPRAASTCRCVRSPRRSACSPPSYATR